MKNNKANAEDLIVFKNLEKLFESFRKGFNAYVRKKYGAQHKNVIHKADMSLEGGVIFLTDQSLSEDWYADFSYYMYSEWLPRNGAKFREITSQLNFIC